MNASEIRQRAIEEVRAALFAEAHDFTGTKYDETYGEVPAEGLTRGKINEVLDRLKTNPIDMAAEAAR